jgi:hypothetical protein
MNSDKRKKLEKAGWRVGSAEDFLGLSTDEAAYLEVKLGLAKELLKRRKTLKLSQVAVAKRIRSSQSRVAKMEVGDPSVSIDLLVKSLIALGGEARALEKIV